ncbi:hypothetical protein [Streptomyces sp. WM4235]|uniref:hypothetical protein n=1 Tax=Streptomyces sp. WM4235 TaxID=1415551 RepID=UPI001F265C84|nr:hypothetical protein [Streptomyces sp. WM4235]
MRYLAESFIFGALRRGRSVEQFLGPVGPPERRGVRYVEVRAARTSYEVYVHAVEDVGHESFLDLDSFPPFDQNSEEEEFGQLLGRAEDPQSALVLAEEGAGAVRGRWVNQGVVQDEYRDFVRVGRPAGMSPDGYPWPDLRTDP